MIKNPSVFMAVFSVFCSTVWGLDDPCECGCPPGAIPTRATVNFQISVDNGTCIGADGVGRQTLKFDAKETTDDGCSGACAHGASATFDWVNEISECSFLLSPTSGTATGSFFAGHYGAGTEDAYWRISFSSELFPGAVGGVVLADGTVFSLDLPSIEMTNATGSYSCDSVSISYSAPEDDGTWSISFSVEGGSCRIIPQFGYKGDCEYEEDEPSPKPVSEDADAEVDPGEDPGSGPDPDPIPDFPSGGGGGGGGSACTSSENESSSPVSYLTGHKVERVTDISVRLPGRDYQLIREYTSDPKFYQKNSQGDYYWNNDFTEVVPGTAGAQWTFNVFQYITGDTGDSSSTLYVEGGRMRSIRKYTKLNNQPIFVSTGAGNSYIEPDIYTSIPWLDAAGNAEDGSNILVWRVRIPGGGEKVYMRVDELATPIANELDRTDLYGLLLYQVDSHGNTFEYIWTTLGTGAIAGRENTRVNEVIASGVDGVAHALIEFDWHGESGTGLPSENTENTANPPINTLGEWMYGRIDEVRVRRPLAGGGWAINPTQRVQYVHYDEIKDIEAQSVFGASLAGIHDELRDTYDAEDGDLCEVIVSKQVDEGGDANGMFSKVTQYRYYAQNNDYGNHITEVANNSAVSELDGFVAAGVAHQLMAVLYPQQIEYYAGRVFNEFGALGGNTGEIASALNIDVSQVSGFQNDVYSSSQGFSSMVQAAERLRWVNFQDGVGSYEFSHAVLLPNSDWSSLFDLAGKFITYYDSATALHGETNRVRTQLVSSSASGCGCGGAGPTIGLGLRYDYMYRRYELDQSVVPPVTVGADFNIVSDGYSCLITESYLDADASGLEYVPYRVHCHDYYWPTSLANGTVSGDGSVSSLGIRRMARALCTASTDWGSVDMFDPYVDPINHAAKNWAITRVYGHDATDPGATQFNNYGKLSAVLTMEAVASSVTGYSAVAESGEGTLSAVIPQSSESGVVVTYDYTDGYLTKKSIEEGTEQTGSMDVLMESVRGSGSDRPDLTNQRTRDAGGGVVQVSTNEYGYYDNTNNIDPNAGIVSWSKSSMAPESPAQNGPGGSTSIDYSNWSFFDRSGQIRWTRDAGGTLTYYEYEEHTGQSTRVIRDADPSDSSIPSNIQINESNFTGITVAGWALPTRTVYDQLADVYAYDSLGRQIESTDAAGVTRYTRRVQMGLSSAVPSNYVKWIITSFGLQYGVLNDFGVGMYATQSFPHKLLNGTFDGPMSISWQDATSASLRESSFECQSNGGSYDPSSSVFTIGNEYARSDSELTVTGSTIRSRQWFDVSQIAPVSAGSFFTETRYDGLGRTYQVIDPLGGVTQYGTDTVLGYDIMDHSLAMARGVKNASSGSISVELVSETFYDSNHTETQGIGNGLVSMTKAYTGEGTESRSTKFWYDFRDRLVGQKNPEAPHQLIGYDVLGRQIDQATWIDGNDFVEGVAGTVPSPSLVSPSRSTYSKTFYNNRGMPYRQVQAVDPTIDPSDQAFPGYLESFTWYNSEGQSVASWGPNGGASKIKYDHLDRPLITYVTDRAGDVLPGPGSYESIFESTGLEVDVSDEHVLSQTEYRYILGGNPGAGQADLVTSRIRLHDTNDLGDLGSTNSVSIFQISHFDDANRVTDSLIYGTNDSLASDMLRSGTSAPTIIDLNRSTSPALISSVRFDEIGRTSISIDPEGKKSLQMYDDLSRSFAVIENYQTGFENSISWVSNNWSVNWGLNPLADENRTTTFTYDLNSNVIKQTAHLNDGSVQVTENEYGVTATAGSGVMESRISSPNILAAVHYPNKTTGQADSSSAYTVSFAYNRLGEMRGRSDQNGTQHAFTRDNLGRMLSDEVTSFGTNIDTAVAEVTTDYDDHGRVSGIYTWDDSSTPAKLTSVEYEYTPMHQIKTLTQNVDVDGSASDERVRYDYTNAEPSVSGGNYTRLTGVRYPAQANGLTNSLNLDYSGAINESLSRVNGIDVPGWSKDKQLVRYTYAGPGMVVKVDYPSGSIGLDATKAPDGSSVTGEYPAYDRFGRVVWHAWVHDSFAAGQNIGGIDYPNATPLMARQYAYDAVSKNRTLDWDGRPGGVLNDRDWEHDYDGLDRLTTSSRGQWDSALSTPALALASNSLQWDLDMLGNWNTVATDLNGSGVFEAGDETELRTHNLANEILTFEGEPSSGPGGSTPIFDPVYDSAGNLTSNGGGGTRGLAYVYDAWNRLVRVERNVPSGTNFSVLENEYNALGWRVIRRMDTAQGAYDGLDEERRYYFNTGWQMVEEHVDTSYSSGSSFLKDYASQQFWGLRYIDDAVAKRIDRDNDGDWAEAADQYHYLTDAMFSVRALTDSGGYVRERIDYTPYGVAMHRYAGDYSGDGVIGAADLTILTAQSGGTVKPGDAGYNPHVDLNGDGVLDGTDISIFLADNAFVTTSGNGVPPSGWLGDPGRTSSDGTDNAFGYDGYWFDAAGATDAGSFGLYTVRNRVYDAGLGRWLTGDPAGFVDGMNLYLYASGTPRVLSDSTGLTPLVSHLGNASDENGSHLYAIDGTFSHQISGRTNTRQFYTNYNGVEAKYWDGPYWLSGRDARGISDDVKKEICADYCKAKRNCNPYSADLVGWSRGGAVAMSISNSSYEGHRALHCRCDDGEVEHPNIRFAGLFDAVDMTFRAYGLAIPDLNLSSVQHMVHIKKTTRNPIQLLAFPTLKSTRGTVFIRNDDGSRTVHSDIGVGVERRNPAYQIMKTLAQRAGLPI